MPDAAPGRRDTISAGGPDMGSITAPAGAGASGWVLSTQTGLAP
jgi:hypothetical protein